MMGSWQIINSLFYLICAVYLLKIFLVNIKVYSGKINNYIKILCRNDSFSLKIKPISHMILIYVSLNELFYKRGCFNVDADITISNRYLESATNIFRIRD